MSVRISTGPAHVLAAGTVTTWFGRPLDLQLDLPEGPLRVRFLFRDDASDPSLRVRPTKTDAGWTFEAINFRGADGRGSSEPVLLGAFDEDLVFLHFRVFRYGETPDHTVHYTFHRVPRAHASALHDEVP